MKENNYLTHGIHPYHAKFIPQIPKDFLFQYGKKGDYVLDPFCGSGTTLLECALNGYQSYGVDLSDIAYLISRAKTFVPDIPTLNNYYDDLILFATSNEPYKSTTFPNKDIWYTKENNVILDKLLYKINTIKDEDYCIIFKVIFSSILKTVSNKRNTWNNGYIADNVMPNKPFTGDVLKVFKNKFKAAKKAYEELAEKVKQIDYKPPVVKLQNILDFKTQIKFDMVITSPPYPFAVDFVKYNRLSYYWFGWNLEERSEEETGSRTKRNRKNAESDFFKEMEIIYKHIFNLIKDGGHFCMTVGNTEREKNKINFVEWLIELFSNNGWTLILNETRILEAQSMAQKRIPTEQKMVFRKG